MKTFHIESATTYFASYLSINNIEWKQYHLMMIGFNMICKSSITIGICWGDGIGEHISNQAERVDFDMSFQTIRIELFTSILKD